MKFAKNIIKKITLAILFSGFGTSVFAASNYSNHSFQDDGKDFQVELILENFTQEFLISTQIGRANISAREQRIQYTPSVTSIGGVKVSWKDLEWSFKTKLREGDEDYIAERGQSYFYDFQFKYQLGKHGIDLYYRTFEGFYADLNASSGFSIDTDGTGQQQDNTPVEYGPSEIIKRPDLNSTNAGFNYAYTAKVFHPYDAEALASTKGFGIFLDLIIAGQYDYFQFYGNDQFIPEDLSDENFNSSLSRISSHTLGGKLGAAFGYYFSEKSLFGTKILAGSGLQLQNLTSDDGNQIDWANNDLFEFDLFYHYIGDVSLFSIALNAQIVGGKTSEDVYFDSNATRFTMSYGLRF